MNARIVAPAALAVALAYLLRKKHGQAAAEPHPESSLFNPNTSLIGYRHGRRRAQ